MNDLVVWLTTGTAAAPPTATDPDPARLPAITSILRVSSAATRAVPPALIAAPVRDGPSAPTNALVVIVYPDPPAFTATATDPPTDAPTETDSTFSLDVASTVASPFTVAVACGAIHA